MQWLKRYSLLIMIIITAIGYGSGKLIKAMEAQVAQIEKEQQQQLEQIAQGQKNDKAEGLTAAPENGQLEGVMPKPENGQREEVMPKPEEGETGEVMPKPEDDQSEGEKREFHRVEMDYLADALFIGDSRTSTIYEYAGWTDTDFFVKNGLSIWEVWDKDMDGTYLETVLQQKQYGKIYIMLGVNELGNETAELFRQEYEAVLKRIQELQPKAIIFVQAIIHVTDAKDSEGTYINNQEIDVRNQEIKKLTDGKKIFWLDANEVFDEPGTGKMSPEYSFDGVHLKVKHLDVWQEFLLEHGI